VYARRTGVSGAVSDARATERVRSLALVWVSGEPRPQEEERTCRGAHRPDEETAVTSPVQTAPALPDVCIQARHTQDPLCSRSRCGASARSSSPAAANRTNSRMTLSVLCIARVFSDRTIAFEPARACSKPKHCGVAVAHLHLFGRFSARSCNHRFLLYPYNDGRAVQLAVEAGAARLRSGGRAASFSGTWAASRRLHRALQMQAGGVPLCRSHEGPARAA
jgi:hypothetical protein